MVEIDKTLNIKFIKTDSAVIPYQVTDADGMPHLPLTLFALELHKSQSAGSVPVYLRAVLHFANWLQHDPVAARSQWDLLDEPTVVRSAVRQYLHAEGNCKIVARPDNLGLKSVYISAADGKHINVRTVLAALKRFYETAIDDNFYPFSNPLVHVEALEIHQQIKKNWREQTLALEGRPRMPSASGVDAPTNQFRLSENYFKYDGDQWKPHTIDAADFPARVFKAGVDFGWKMREQCVARILFESGARISEVLSLNAGDWADGDFGHRLRAQNKGSHRKRTKTLIISQSTAKLLRRYFESAERQQFAPEQYLFRDLSSLKRRNPRELDGIPIFINRRGNQMTPALFRDYYWRPALLRAGIDADPHTCRHWFVTNAIKTIETVSMSREEEERRKEELIGYMSWRTGEKTLKVYEHVSRTDSFQKTIAGIHGKMQRSEKSYKKFLHNETLAERKRENLTESYSSSATAAREDLAFILGDDCV